MRTFWLGGMAMVLAAACSSGSAGGGDAGKSGSSSGGSSSSGGGSSSGSTTCSGKPQGPVLGSCSEYLGNMLLLCESFTGPANTMSEQQQACSLSTEKLSSSPCPTSGVVGGFCIHECGLSNEFVSYIYQSSIDPQSQCQMESGYYVP